MTKDQRTETLCRDSLRFSIRNTETKHTTFFALGDYTIYAQKNKKETYLSTLKKDLVKNGNTKQKIKWGIRNPIKDDKQGIRNSTK